MSTVKEIAKTWDKAAINTLLMNNDRAVCRALVVLHNRQTSSEQITQTTNEHNGIGFTGADAEFLSSLAERVKKGWGLTPKQLACVRRTNKAGFCQLAKYHGQLREEIAAKMGSVA